MRHGVRLKGIKRVRKPDGKVYVYRRIGSALVALPNLAENHPEFLLAYAQAGGDDKPLKSAIGSLEETIRTYCRSPEFIDLADGTQKARGAIFRKICESAKNGHRVGDVRFSSIAERHIRSWLNELSPSAANNHLKAWRGLMGWGVGCGRRNDNPTSDLSKRKERNEHRHAWTEAEIAIFCSFYEPGTRERMALELFLCTGQRRSDIVRAGRQHIENGFIHFKTQKTGRELILPVSEDLQREIDLLPPGQMTFLLTDFCKPFTADGFGGWWRKVCDKAGLPHWTSHGGRHAKGRQMAEAGCSTHEIMATLGVTLKEAERYTSAAQQAVLAQAGARRTERNRKSGN